MISSSEGDQRPWYAQAIRGWLLPLVVIVLLVYVASQTLLPAEDGAGAIIYSDAKRLIRDSPEEIDLATFRPKGHVLELKMEDGRELETNYPSDESALALEELLDDSGIQYDSTGTGDSAWWSILTYLLPFVLFLGFWIFLMKQMRGLQRGEASSAAERDVDAP